MQSRHLATILNSRHYCPDGRAHEWGPKLRWRKQRCVRCDEKKEH